MTFKIIVLCFSWAMFQAGLFFLFHDRKWALKFAGRVFPDIAKLQKRSSKTAYSLSDNCIVLLSLVDNINAIIHWGPVGLFLSFLTAFAWGTPVTVFLYCGLWFGFAAHQSRKVSNRMIRVTNEITEDLDRLIELSEMLQSEY